ncbi:hypothetical protein TREAZ_2921 [Leadbettera azotonutricia ZAS-9]|uniref:Uncharacterized protein n=1 Tax=Leadbettera azotonutricia (strain ATCC BAA-888 / DSM 13862 / ZAS-9) TaxID=545695 RepID=F5YBU5_LEAAZ|nr:hypothetical protein TREAZ_2921 [Leadbettera azotonutricia ZAS-9]
MFLSYLLLGKSNFTGVELFFQQIKKKRIAKPQNRESRIVKIIYHTNS